MFGFFLSFELSITLWKIAWFAALFFRSVANRQQRVDEVGSCGDCLILCNVSVLAFNNS